MFNDDAALYDVLIFSEERNRFESILPVWSFDSARMGIDAFEESWNLETNPGGMHFQEVLSVDNSEFFDKIEPNSRLVLSLKDYLNCFPYPHVFRIVSGFDLWSEFGIPSTDRIVSRHRLPTEVTLTEPSPPYSSENRKAKQHIVSIDFHGKFKLLPYDPVSSDTSSLHVFVTVLDLVQAFPIYVRCNRPFCIGSTADEGFSDGSNSIGFGDHLKLIRLTFRNGEKLLECRYLSGSRLISLPMSCAGDFTVLPNDNDYTLEDLVSFQPCRRRIRLAGGDEAWRNAYQLPSDRDFYIEAYDPFLEASPAANPDLIIGIPRELDIMVSPDTGSRAVNGELLNTFVTHHRSQFPLLVRVTDWKEETSVLENHFVRPGVELVIHGWTRQTKVLARAAGRHYAVPLTYGGLFRTRSRIFSGAIQLWNVRPKSRLRVIRPDQNDPTLAAGDVIRLRRNQDDDWSPESGSDRTTLVRETKKFLRCEKQHPATGQFIDIRIPLTCIARFEETLEEIPANPEAIHVRELVKTLTLRDVEVDLVSPSPDRPSRDRDLPERTLIILSDNATEQAIYVSVESPSSPAFHLPLRTLIYVALVRRLDKQCSPLLTKQAPKLSTLDRCVELLPGEVFDSLRPLQRSFESPDIVDDPSSHKVNRSSEESEEAGYRQPGTLSISIKSRHETGKQIPPTTYPKPKHQLHQSKGTTALELSMPQNQRPHSKLSTTVVEIQSPPTDSVDSSPSSSLFKPSDTSSLSSLQDSNGLRTTVLDQAGKDSAYLVTSQTTRPAENYTNYLGQTFQLQNPNLQTQTAQQSAQLLQDFVFRATQPSTVMAQPQIQFLQPQLQLDQTQLGIQGQMVQPQIQMTQSQMQAALLQLLQPHLQQQVGGVQMPTAHPQFAPTLAQVLQPQMQLIQAQNLLNQPQPQLGLSQQPSQPQVQPAQPQMLIAQIDNQNGHSQTTVSHNQHSATLALGPDLAVPKSTKKHRAPVANPRPPSIHLTISPTSPDNQPIHRSQVDSNVHANALNHTQQNPNYQNPSSTSAQPFQNRQERPSGSSEGLPQQQQQQTSPIEIPPGFGMIQLESHNGFNIPPGFALVPLSSSPTNTSTSTQAPVVNTKQVTFSQTEDDSESSDDDVRIDPEVTARKIAALKLKIPDDGNLYHLSAKKFVDLLAHLRIGSETIKAAKKSNIDGKKFSSWTEEELAMKSLGNPVLMHFKRQTAKFPKKSFVL